MRFAKKAYIFAILTICCFSATSTIFSQTFEDAFRPFWYATEYGASSSAIAYNNTAASTDFSVLSANPANLCIIKNPNAFVSFQYGLLNQHGKLGKNKDISSLDRYFLYDGLGLIYPVPVYRGSFALGLAYVPSYQYNYTLKSGGIVQTIFDSDTFDVYQKHDVSEVGALYSLRLGSAVEFKKNLFFGFSLNFHNGYRNYQYTGVDIDTEDVFTYSNFIREETIKPDYKGWNADFGALYRLPHFKFGLKISTPLKLKVHEKSSFDWYESYDDQSEESGSDPGSPFDINYTTTFPFEISTGLAFSFYDISIALDIATRDWGSITFESDLYTDTTFTIKSDPEINNDIHSNLRPTMDFGVGLIIPIYETISAQLGYRIIPRPFYDLPDNEKNITLLGFGLKGTIEDQIVVGLSYQLRMGRQSIYNDYFETSPESSTTIQRFQKHQFTISSSLLF